MKQTVIESDCVGHRKINFFSIIFTRFFAFIFLCPSDLMREFPDEPRRDGLPDVLSLTAHSFGVVGEHPYDQTQIAV